MSIPFEAKAAEGLEHLGLKVAHQHLDQTAQQAASDWSYTHFLGFLLDAAGVGQISALAGGSILRAP